jgi:hypothetical protein
VGRQLDVPFCPGLNDDIRFMTASVLSHRQSIEFNVARFWSIGRAKSQASSTRAAAAKVGVRSRASIAASYRLCYVHSGRGDDHVEASEEDFRDEKNFTVVISYDHAEKFKKAGIDNPANYCMGKKLRVTGKVIAENNQVRIRADDPAQIKIVDEGE